MSERSVFQSVALPLFRWARIGFTCLALGGLMTACVDPIAPGATPTPADQVLWRLQVAPRGITMAVGQSVTLRSTTLNILGDPITLPDSSAITFLSADTSRVTVTPDGLVTGRSATLAFPGLGQLAPISVIASLTVGEVVRADTIYVAVTDTAPTHAPHTVNIAGAPYPADSTWTVTFKIIPITMLTITGDTIPNPFLYLHTERWRKGLREQITPNNRFMLFISRPPGRFWIYATGWVYGVEFQDSTEYVRTDGNAVIRITPNPANPNMAIPIGVKDDTQFMSPCQTISIENQFPVPVDVVFDDPSSTTVCAPGDETGNVMALPPGQTTYRRIRASGTYRWTVTRTGGPALSQPFTGLIRVRAHTDF